MTNQLVAGMDIGGTKIAIGLGDLNGQLLELEQFPNQIELGPERIIEKAAGNIQRLLDKYHAKMLGLGIGCAGPLDRRRGLILSPPNLLGWDEFPIVKILQDRFGVRVALDNDANVAALGEHYYGAGRELQDLVYITISTGIGGGVIVAGEIVHGVCDGAGEVGHTTVLLGGPPCGCGNRGCLESLSSGTSIARRARERLSSSDVKSVMRARDITAKDVAEAARNGDSVAQQIWDETIYYLAIGIGNIINTLAPEAVILGGGVSMAGDQLLVPLRAQVRARMRMVPPEAVNISQAALGRQSGIYGALLLAQRSAVQREPQPEATNLRS